MQCSGSIGMDCGIRDNLRKELEENDRNLNMNMLYSNLCINEICYKLTSLQLNGSAVAQWKSAWLETERPRV